MWTGVCVCMCVWNVIISWSCKAEDIGVFLVHISILISLLCYACVSFLFPSALLMLAASLFQIFHFLLTRISPRCAATHPALICSTGVLCQFVLIFSVSYSIAHLTASDCCFFVYLYFTVSPLPALTVLINPPHQFIPSIVLPLDLNLDRSFWRKCHVLMPISEERLLIFFFFFLMNHFIQTFGVVTLGCWFVLWQKRFFLHCVNNHEVKNLQGSSLVESNVILVAHPMSWRELFKPSMGSDKLAHYVYACFLLLGHKMSARWVLEIKIFFREQFCVASK